MSQTCHFFPHQAEEGKNPEPSLERLGKHRGLPLSRKPRLQLVNEDHLSPVGQHEGHGALAEAHQIAS